MSKKKLHRLERRTETESVDCGRILAGDKNYTKQFTGANRIVLKPKLPDMSCIAIQSRIVSHNLKPLKLATVFARIVYQDYEFLELQVKSSYHPQNLFCFSIDAKSSADFKWMMRQMGQCLPNVFVLDEELSIDRSGHNMNNAHYNCMQEMEKRPDWAYFVLMQNHDVIGKTVYQISRIFELMGGANDVEIEKDRRTDKKLKWDPKSLHLFRNESKISPKVLERPLQMAKGTVHASMSRKAVEWLVKQVDMTVFFKQWNQGRFGVDEQWISTFQSNEFLEMPGHFTGKCIYERGQKTDFITRFSKWSHDQKKKRCGSGYLRHSVCVLGIEDFSIVAQMPNLMFNKMMPTFDYTIAECTAELLYNRTFLDQTDLQLEEDYYSNMPHVLYHKHHHQPGYQLNCTSGYLPWNSRPYPL